MLDLFKKEEINVLKARINELEEENKRLSIQLEKRDERARKAIAEKQEVDRELNEARQKLSSLESEIEKLKKETSPELRFSFSESFSKQKLDELMFLLNSMQSKTSTLMTIYLAKDAAAKNIPQSIANQIDISALYLIDKIESNTGKAVFYDANKLIKLVIIPVLPIVRSEAFLEKQFNLEPLKRSLEVEKALVLNAHAGETFMGILEDNNFVEDDIIRSSVMGKHAKGGWSQKRFQSLVEEDVKHHADRVRESLAPMIEKHKDIQYVIAGGDGKLVKMVLEGYNYPLIMKSMEPAGKRGAEQVLREALSVRVYGI